VNVQGDGGTLFTMAVGVWVSAVVLVLMHRESLLGVLKKR